MMTHSVLVGVLFVLVVALVWQSNYAAEHSLAIRKLEQEKQQLAESIADLQWQVSASRSLASVSSRAAKLSLAPPQGISFLEIGSSAVAVAADAQTGVTQ